MTQERVQELLNEANNERLSWGEIAEIDAAAVEAGIENIQDATAIDVLLELESRVKA